MSTTQTETVTKQVALITGSTRLVRIGPYVTQLIYSMLSKDLSPLPSHPETKFDLEIVDLAAFNLPIFNERVSPVAVPMYAKFEHAHSIAWSAAISRFDAYILITPCYNAGPPGSVKNALDYLFNEIKGKPWMLISYGIQGGGPASSSLAISLRSMRCEVVPTMPALKFEVTEPKVRGMSADVMAGLQGRLGEVTRARWEGQREEVVKGWGEVKEALVRDVKDVNEVKE